MLLRTRNSTRAATARRAGATTLAIGLALTLLLSGCGSAGEARPEKIELTVALFTDFGYQELYKRYEREHPEIKITERIVEYSTHHKNLTDNLAAGTGAADIEAIETGFINQFKAQPEKFVDLRKYGADQLRERWLDWKWQASLARTGEQIGYGTDVGGLAICYRRDLFAQAGLPTDRDEVSASWPTWEKYIEVGRRYTARAPEGTHFYDGGIHLFNAILGQAPVGYYDTSDRLVVATNPAVRQAWDLVVESIQAGQSAALMANAEVWDEGFAKGKFATITCPAWMMGKIQDQAAHTAGKWDVALVPGRGGNWGGSYLTVPAQSRHAREAAELAAWLTAPEQQAHVFTTHGSLPSIPALYDDPEIVNFTSDFFNGAPVGKIFTSGAKNLTPQYQGPRAGEIQIMVRDALIRVEEGTQDPEESWRQLLADVAKLDG